MRPPRPLFGCITSPIYGLSRGMVWSAAVYLSVLAVVTVALNLAVLYNTLSERATRRSTIGKIFLCLATIDLFTGAVAIPAAASLMYHILLGTPHQCWQHYIALTSGVLSVLLSLSTITVISIGRLVTMARPYRKHSWSWLWWLGIVVAWSYCCVIAFFTFSEVWSGKVFRVTYNGTILLCVVVSTLAYCCIVGLTRRMNRRVAAEPPSDVPLGEIRREENHFRMQQRRISRACLIATVLLVLMHLPIIVSRLLSLFDAFSMRTWQVMVIVSNSIAFTNSAVNPVVYAKFRTNAFSWGRLLRRIGRIGVAR